jgi:oligoribonuclease (3'-5' exoribonuclease)
LQEVTRRNWVLAASQEEIEAHVLGGEAGDFHHQHSMPNGLLDECLKSWTTHEQWRNQLLRFLQTHCAEGCRLAGYSVHCDRDVLRVQAPKVYAFLSHRILDVPSLDLVEWGLPALETDARMARMGGAFDGNHRAMSDTEAAIAKVKWYHAWLKDNFKQTSKYA